MSEPYLGEIRIFAQSWAPKNWCPCDGRLLSIREHKALYSLLTNQFGGYAASGTFALPDLRGRAVIGEDPAQTGINFIVGQTGGVETVDLANFNLPAHSHAVVADATNAASGVGQGNYLAQPQTSAKVALNLYAPAGTATTTLNPQVASSIGDDKRHNNMQPFQAVNYCICYELGDYPPRND